MPNARPPDAPWPDAPWPDAPWSEAQEPLLDLLAELVSEQGARRLLRAPLVEPNARAFPEPYEATLVGVGRLLHRLLHFAGLGEWPFDLVDARPPLEQLSDLDEQTRTPLVSFIAVDAGRLTFQIDQLGPSDLLVAALCHAVGHALSAVPASDRRSTAVTAAPKPSEVDASDEKRESEKAAVATIFLGLGLLTVPAASDLRHASKLVGHAVHGRTALVVIGALPTGDLTFLLAVWWILRFPLDRPAVADHLDRAAAADVTRWLEVLLPVADALRRRIGMPALETVAPARMPEVPSLREADRAKLAAADEKYRRPHAERSAHRIYELKTATYAVLFGVVGAVGGILLAAAGSLAGFFGAIAAATVVGGVIGRRYKSYYCGACWMLLRAHEKSCPKCGAQLAGDRPRITRASQMPDEKEEDDELTRAALAAGGDPSDGDSDGE